MPDLPTKQAHSPEAEQRKLCEVLRGCGSFEISGNPDVLVSDVTHRTSLIRRGSLFFCVTGARYDGHNFAEECYAAGAAGLVVERWIERVPCVQIRFADVRKIMGPISSEFFGRPVDQLTISVGITGTYGKTTTSHILDSIIRASGLRSAVIGSLGIFVDSRPIPTDTTTATTPEAPDLNRLLAQMIRSGTKALVLEVTAQALEHHRVDGMRFGCTVFTNLHANDNHRHLDHYGSMTNYFRVKQKLFTPEHCQTAVVNFDSAEGRFLAENSRVPTTSYSITSTDANFTAKDIILSDKGITFAVDGLRIKSSLRGVRNLYNLLAACATARHFGIDSSAIAAGVEAISSIPGRMEPLDLGQPFNIFIDFAHYPCSLENTLKSVRELSSGRIITVFGCRGNWNPEKRSLIGETITRLSDISVLTSDDPCDEEPAKIIYDVEQGAIRGAGHYVVEPDRNKAIEVALTHAQAGDSVLIAGSDPPVQALTPEQKVWWNTEGSLSPIDDRALVVEFVRRLRLQNSRTC